MKKSDLRALERIFESDVTQAMNRHPVMPFRSAAKVYEQLETDGLVRRMEVKIGSGWSAVAVKGWALTAAGHLAYCMSCADDPEAEAAAAALMKER